MARLGKIWRRFTGWLTGPRVAALLLGVLGVLIGFGGYLYRYCDCQGWPNLVSGWDQLFLDFYANAATTFVGFTVAVLTIDLLNERRVDKQLKAQLIREVRSTDNALAIRAVEELFAHGWAFDGSLQGANLLGANLQGAFFFVADLQGASLIHANLQRAGLLGTKLQGANLRGANLQEADLLEAQLQRANLYRANLQRASLIEANLHEAKELTDQQLVMVNALRGATLPDGNHYDGRFNLKGDIEEATKKGINPKDPKMMADWYGVPLETYIAGQKWADENLPGLRREAGLEEAAEPGEVPQPEEQQRDVPLLPVVPTQSLLSFTVRRLIGLFWPFIV